MAPVIELAFAIDPVPFEVHMIPALFDVEDPAVIFTAPEFEQVVTTSPATAVGAVVIVKFFVDTAVEHGLLPVAVSVRVIVPVSPAPGV